MSKTHVEGLFSTPVFIADNIGGQATMEVFRSFDIKDNRSGLQNLSDSMNVLGNPKLQHLSTAIWLQAHKFIIKTLGIDPKYQMNFVSSWITRLKPDANFTTHFHPCSQFSGVYYPVDQKEISLLTFTHPLTQFNWIGGNMTPDRVINDYTYNETTYACLPDRLLVFPSHLPHRVVKNWADSNNDRYSLAFNIMLSGDYTTNAETVRIDAKPL